jgi:hypothetical protein
MSDYTHNSSSARTAGPLILGFQISYGLFGILCAQTYIYFSRYQRDKKWFRALVASVFALESLLVICRTFASWENFAVDPRIPTECTAASARLPYSQGSQPINATMFLSSCQLLEYKATVLGWYTYPQLLATSLIASLIHGFYCFRIWQLLSWYEAVNKGRAGIVKWGILLFVALVLSVFLWADDSCNTHV